MDFFLLKSAYISLISEVILSSPESFTFDAALPQFMSVAIGLLCVHFVKLMSLQILDFILDLKQSRQNIEGMLFYIWYANSEWIWQISVRLVAFDWSQKLSYVMQIWKFLGNKGKGAFDKKLSPDLSRNIKLFRISPITVKM